MAFWQKKEAEFEATYELLEEHGGMRPADVARQMDVEPSTVGRRLAGMEEAGYLLSEDDKGGLWPFKRKA